jgi:hypothetical protein
MSRQSAFAKILKTIPGNDCATQRKRFLTAMQLTGHVTSLEAFRYLDIYRPAARIFELRNEAVPVVTVMRQEETEAGGLHRVGVYFLKDERRSA